MQTAAAKPAVGSKRRVPSISRCPLPAQAAESTLLGRMLLRKLRSKVTGQAEAKSTQRRQLGHEPISMRGLK